MIKSDYRWVLVLIAFAIFIWARDLRWMATADDILPIVAGLPLFVWLRSPWRFAPHAAGPRSPALLTAAGLFTLGVAIDRTLVLTLSWLVLLWAWTSTRTVDGRARSNFRLLALPLFSFPWVATDFAQLGWWFRLSGAAGAEQILGAFDAPVVRDGTLLTIGRLQLSVEPACSGLNGLQSLLIAGTMIAFITLSRSPFFWVGLMVLPFAAWGANVIRILSGAVVALAMEPAAAARWVGPLHSAAGWVALVVMFGACWLLFSRLARLESMPSAWRTGRNAPWLEIAILSYGVWRCRELVDVWFASPFDRWGWLAFALWLLPLGVAARGPLLAAGSGVLRPWLLGAGLALIGFGDVGELNAAKYLGLAVILIGFAPPRGRLLWALMAVAWMPALGWIASRLAIPPDAMSIARVALALVGCGWVLALQQRKLQTEEPKFVTRFETLH